MTAEVIVEEEFVRQERLWLPELVSLSSISCRSVDLPLPSTDPFFCWKGGDQKSCETPQCVGSVVSACLERDHHRAAAGSFCHIG